MADNPLARFFSREAGQQRRRALNALDQRIGDALGYYLGPQLAPRVGQAANALAMFSPGMDVQEAVQASGDMMAPNRTPLDRAASGAALAGALGAMFMPGGVSSIRQGVEDVADAAVRAYDPARMGSNLGNVTRETPAEEVARLLREGRANEVTDELFARADPLELSRLYEGGATGMDMPSDTASRMARAEGMGFDTAVYHGGTSDIRALSPFEGGAEGGQGVLFSSDEARVANTYAPRRAQPMGENVMPLIARSGGYREAGYTRPFPADGSDAEIENWLAGLEQFDRRMSQPGVKSNVFSQQIEAARANSQPGVVFRQVVDDRIDTSTALPSDVFATIDPTTIRSRFARFDPRLSHLANLNAGFAGAGVLGAGALAMQPGEAQAMPPEASFLEKYLP